MLNDLTLFNNTFISIFCFLFILGNALYFNSKIGRLSLKSKLQSLIETSKLLLEGEFAIIAIMFPFFAFKVLYLFPLIYALCSVAVFFSLILIILYLILLLSILFEITSKVFYYFYIKMNSWHINPRFCIMVFCISSCLMLYIFNLPTVLGDTLTSDEMVRLKQTQDFVYDSLLRNPMISQTQLVSVLRLIKIVLQDTTPDTGNLITLDDWSPVNNVMPTSSSLKQFMIFSLFSILIFFLGAFMNVSMLAYIASNHPGLQLEVAHGLQEVFLDPEATERLFNLLTKTQVMIFRWR